MQIHSYFTKQLLHTSSINAQSKVYMLTHFNISSVRQSKY